MRAKDNAGHWGETRHFGPVKVDTKPPTASISISGDKGENEWYISDVVLDCDTTDPAPSSGIKECLIQVDGELWQTAPVSVTSNGIHTIAFYAVDNAGNEGDRGFLELKIDKAKPAFTGWVHIPDQLCRDMVDALEVQVNIGDEISGVSAIPQLTYEVTGGHADEGVSGVEVDKGMWSFRIFRAWNELGGETLAYTVRVPDNAGNLAKSTNRQVGVEQQSVYVEPGSIDYGAVRIYRSETETVSIHNTGCAPLGITSITIDSDGQDDFGGIPAEVAPIEPGKKRDILLKWTPSKEYKLNGRKLIIESNAPDSPTAIALSGYSYRCETTLAVAPQSSVVYGCPISIYITLTMEGISPDVIRKQKLTVIYTKPSGRPKEQTVPNSEGPEPNESESNTHIARLPAEEIDEIGLWNVAVYWEGDDECVPVDGNTSFQVNRVPTKIEWDNHLNEPVSIDKLVTLSGNIVADTICSGELPNIAGQDVHLRITNPHGIVDGDFDPDVKTEADETFEAHYAFHSEGNWTVEASWDGDNIYEGCDSTKVVSVVIEPPKAIVLLGGDKTSPDFDTFNSIANRVYSILNEWRGFRHEDIYYLNPREQQEQKNKEVQVDGFANEGNLADALDWAEKSVGPHTPLLIYMLSHNRDDNFLLGVPDEVPANRDSIYLTSDEVNAQLSMLEQALLSAYYETEQDSLVEPTSITIIVDACYSGDFLEPLSKVIENSKSEIAIRRTVITSTSTDEKAYIKLPDSFSSAFFAYINYDYDIKDAFVNSRNTIISYKTQSPLLDADGNGKPNERSDYENVTGVKIGSLTGDVLMIKSVWFEPENLELDGENSAVIWVSFIGIGVDSANVTIIPPDYGGSQGFDSWDDLGKGLTQIDLVEEDDLLYRGEYKFTKSGTYTLVVHMENLDAAAAPYKATITINSVEPTDKQPTTWAMVKNTKLYQNYPNPFNPETWIPFQLADASDVTLTIYNLQGKIIHHMELGMTPAGAYITRDKAMHWDGHSQDREPVASGTYFYCFRAGDYVSVKRMVLLR